MVEGGGVCVRRDSGRKETWLEIGQQLKEGGNPVGLGCSVHPSARLSRCVLGELMGWGQGLRQGNHHRWCRDCIHGDGQAVGVTVAGSPGWSGPDHIGSRHNREGWR